MFLKDRPYARYLGTQIPEEAKEAYALGLITVTRGDDWMYDEYIDIALVDHQPTAPKSMLSRLIEFMIPWKAKIPR